MRKIVGSKKISKKVEATKKISSVHSVFILLQAHFYAHHKTIIAERFTCSEFYQDYSIRRKNRQSRFGSESRHNYRYKKFRHLQAVVLLNAQQLQL